MTKPQRLQRIDPEFDKWLNKIKKERLLKGLDKEPIGRPRIQKIMMKLPSFKKMQEELLFDNRGAVLDIFVWIIIGFIFIILMGSWIFMHDQITSTLVGITGQGGSPVNISSAAADTFGNVNAGYGVFRWSLGGIILAMGLSILISNFLVRVNPVFIIPYMLIVVIAIIFSVEISNSYQTSIASDETIGSTVTSFIGANFIYNNLPIWVAIIGVFGGIFLMIGILRDRDSGGSFV